MVAEYGRTGRLDSYAGDLAAARVRLTTPAMGRSADFVLRDLSLRGGGGPRALLAYLHGTVDERMLDGTVLEAALDGAQPGQATAAAVQRALLPVAQVIRQHRWTDIFASLLDGHPVLLIAGLPEAFVLNLAKWPARAVSSPDSEASIKGSQEAFAGPLTTNLALLRRYVRSEQLRFDRLVVGRRSHTHVCVCYLDGLANPALVGAVKGRIAAMDVSEVLNSTTVQNHLADQALSLFPLTRSTQRIDSASKDLTAGKVLIVVDNDPFVISAPSTLDDFYQTAQDYQFNFWTGTYGRLVRLVGVLLALYLPSLYIALDSVNPGMMPIRFLLTVAGSREGIPFPPILEVVVMFVIIEVLREATMRLPERLGTAIGTVGAIVLGTAIVKAGIVSSQMIIVVTLTALAVFTVPDFAMSGPLRILFWPFVLGANLLGIFGILIGTWFALGYVARLSSFGQPLFSPWGPLVLRDQGDAVLRLPLMALRRRQSTTHALDETSQGAYLQPDELPPLDAATRPPGGPASS